MDYSEALPIPAGPNNVVLSCWRNFWENTLGSDWRANGRPFHIKGPITEKTRLCMTEVRANGTWRRPLKEAEVGVLRAYSVLRAWPIREYQTRTATLTSMRCLRGSQWRTSAYRQIYIHSNSMILTHDLQLWLTLTVWMLHVYNYVCMYVCIGIDFGGQPGCAPNNWETPMHLSVFTTFSPQNLGLPLQYFW